MRTQKIVLAVSGGIDSMVMLDWIAKKKVDKSSMIVAHFDHGTRDSAADDATFVHQKALTYGVKYRVARGELGEDVSEEVAREARYEFLREVGEDELTSDSKATTKDADGELAGAEIYTAHHLDDLVETVAINLLRGTGWRGLAVLDRPGVRRPFLEPETSLEWTSGGTGEPWGEGEPWGKREILRYAAANGIVFRQDPTNTTDDYLRNRVRERLRGFDKTREIYRLWQKQKELKRAIDRLVEEILPARGEPWERGWFVDLDEKVALELLRAGTLRAGVRATRPQLEAFRQAILHYAPGKYFNLPGDKLVRFTKSDFEI